MAQFQSPRFTNDELLLEILNDPDTGTVKLGPGSPPASVMTLQEALFDLMWNLRTTEPVIRDRSEFVVGNYGPKTTQAVTAFKTRYGIHFPPSEPTGIIDGFAGPRTFAKLDELCVFLDRAVDSIARKATELIDRGLDVTFVNSDRLTTPIDGTSGTLSLAEIAGTPGAIYFKRGMGGEANEVHGDIFRKYVETGPLGPLGFPITDEEDVDDLPGFRSSHFEHGRIRLEVATGVVDQLISQPSSPETDPLF